MRLIKQQRSLLTHIWLSGDRAYAVRSNFFTHFAEDENRTLEKKHFLYQFILEKNDIDTFPNVTIALRVRVRFDMPY